MPGQVGGRSGRGRSKSGGSNGGVSGNKQLVESLREACPPHKQNDLEALVKSLKSDEAKCREKISEWWEQNDQPTTTEEGEWEDVNKRAHHKAVEAAAGGGTGKPVKTGGRGGRGEVRGGGRAASAGRDSSGRGRGREHGRGGPRRSKEDSGAGKLKKDGKPHDAEMDVNPMAPVQNVSFPNPATVRSPQGAWAPKKSEEAENETAETLETSENTPAVPAVGDREPPANADSGPLPMTSPPVPTEASAAPKAPTGNVWATKGSAHLIQKEKPKPPPVPATQAPIQRKNNNNFRKSGSNRSAPSNDAIAPPSAVPQEMTSAMDALTAAAASTTPIHTEPVAPPIPKEVVTPPPPRISEPILETTAPAAANNAWKPAPSVPAPPTSAQVQNLTPPPPTAPVATREHNKSKAPANVLNMGRWDAGDTDDNLDFGFGAFGAEEPTMETPKQPQPSPASAAAGPSPARPPPGLSIGGMPPMPANAVLVHELENKLESVSMANSSTEPPPSALAGLPTATSQPPHPNTVTHIPPGQIHTATSTQQPGGYPYGGMGMYNPGNAFIGMPPAGGPGLGVPQQAPKGPIPPAQPNLYNSAPSSGNSATGAVASSTNTAANANAGGAMPPGMPGMPYGNPMYYQQQQFAAAAHMGQHQPGIGYNYGYGGQFAGGVQGGFGYPGGMHGNAGYGHGGPQFDDAGGSGGGGYNQQKNAGGYRGGGGRNSHNNSSSNNNNAGGGGGGGYQSHHYGQHHQQQHGGYGGQPYGMGYQADHFGQGRGGYGNMQDPYGMQQGGGAGGGGGSTYGGTSGFQGDDQYNKNKKGGGGGNRGGGGGGGFNQFQPPQPQQQQHGGPHHQPFGLQGQGGGTGGTGGSDTSQPTGGDGWPNQGWSGAGWQGK